MNSEILFEVINTNHENQELFDFIENSSNGTIFHHPRFLAYHDEQNNNQSQILWNHFIFRNKNKIIAFLPGAMHQVNNNLCFSSPCGASFGGFATKASSFNQYDQILDLTLDFLINKEKVTEVNIAPPTSIYMGNEPDEYFDYLYLSKGFEINKCDLTIATKILNTQDFPRKIFKNRVRSSINKCKKNGVVCKISENHDIAYPIIEENKKKFEKKPTHSLTDLKIISNLFPGHILQFIAFHEDIPIAAITVVLCNSTTAYTFYISHLEKYARFRPVDFLINEILIWLMKKEYLYLDFGPSTFGYTPHPSLIFFKEGFGGKGIIKYFYRYKI